MIASPYEAAIFPHQTSQPDFCSRFMCSCRLSQNLISGAGSGNCTGRRHGELSRADNTGTGVGFPRWHSHCRRQRKRAVGNTGAI
jgi:hypothetical protein